MLCTCGTCGGSGSAVLLAGLKGYGSHWELGQLLLGKRNRIRGGGIVRTCRGGFAVVLQGFVLLAQFFVGLAHHALDKRIIWVRLLKLLQCRFVISCIERDVAFQIREERRLLRNGALVENGLDRKSVV